MLQKAKFIDLKDRKEMLWGLVGFVDNFDLVLLEVVEVDASNIRALVVPPLLVRTPRSFQRRDSCIDCQAGYFAQFVVAISTRK